MTGGSAPDRRIESLFLLPSLMTGGAEAQAITLINELSADRFNKRLVTFEPATDQLGRLDRSTVDWIQCPRRAKVDRSLARRLAALIDEHRIDVVHCTLQIALFFGWLARRASTRRPGLVTTVHKTYNQSLKTELIDQVFARVMMTACERIVFVCRHQQRHWTRRFPALEKNATVIYNGVDIERYEPAAQGDARAGARARYGLADADRVIACLARFSPEKGQAVLVEAVARIPGRPVLLLAGDGPTRPAIEQAVERLDLGDRVRLLGAVDDVRPVLAAADVAVLTSIAETFSMARLEAMSMGLAVVGSDVGGMGEAVEPGVTGDLVRPGDADALAGALERILGDDAARQRMGRAARALVERRFTRKAMVDATQRVLEDVAEQRRVAEAATS